MSVKQTTVYSGPGYPVDPAREELRYRWPGIDWLNPVALRPSPIYSMLLAQMDNALERQRQELRFTRTIRRVETIVNFKEEFGFGTRPDWNEFVTPKEIWSGYDGTRDALKIGWPNE